MKYLLLTICVFTLTGKQFHLRAQNLSERNPSLLDDKYEPNSSSTFNISKENRKNEFNKEQDVPSSFIKFSPTFLFRRKVAFFYNLKLVNGLVLDLGLAKAFNSDPISDLGLSTFGSMDYTDAYLSADEWMSNSTYTGSTPLVSLGFRYYFDDEAYQGYYLMSNYRFEKMEYKLNSDIGDIPIINSDRNMELVTNGFLIGYGATWLAGKKNNIINELEMSFGLRFAKYNRYDRIEVPSSSTSYYSYVYAYQKTNQYVNKNVFVMNITYYIGFGF